MRKRELPLSVIVPELLPPPVGAGGNTSGSSIGGCGTSGQSARANAVHGSACRVVVVVVLEDGGGTVVLEDGGGTVVLEGMPPPNVGPPLLTGEGVGVLFGGGLGVSSKPSTTKDILSPPGSEVM